MARTITSLPVGLSYPFGVPEIGLFPLELALLPTERVPLHIFEPRYKELIRECIADESEFGLVLADDDGRREVGTRAAVVEVLQIFDDGRLNVLVEGRERFRIVEETEGRSFLTGEVEPVDDEREDGPTEAETERATALFQRLVELADADVDVPGAAAPALSFELAARVDLGTALKQDLLELTSERERLQRVCEVLEQAVEGLAAAREVQERAATNGKVSRAG
jgi:Lon protease-like protein